MSMPGWQALLCKLQRKLQRWKRRKEVWGTLSRFLTSGMCHLVPTKGRRQATPTQSQLYCEPLVQRSIPHDEADRPQAGSHHFISALTRPESAMVQVAGSRTRLESTRCTSSENLEGGIRHRLPHALGILCMSAGRSVHESEVS